MTGGGKGGVGEITEQQHAVSLGGERRISALHLPDYCSVSSGTCSPVESFHSAPDNGTVASQRA